MANKLREKRKRKQRNKGKNLWKRTNKHKKGVRNIFKPGGNERNVESETSVKSKKRIQRLWNN